MPIKKRGNQVIPKEVTAEREKRVWELRQSMWTQGRIAKELKISQPAVAKILKRMTERYGEELMDDVKKVKAEQILQLEHVADEGMQAWEKSKGTIKTAWIKRPLQSDGKPSSSFGEQTQEVKEQNGDPRYLAIAMKAKEDIRKIIGADAPTKNFNFNRDMSELSDEELLAISKGEIPVK